MSDTAQTSTSPALNAEHHPTEQNQLTPYDVAVIGGGVAGLSAGIYSARDGFKTIIFEGDYTSSVEMPGGALLLTSSIENFPGFKEGAGEDLISVIRDQAETFGAEIVTSKIHAADFATEVGQNHILTDQNGEKIHAKTVIISTGAIARQLHIPGEAEMYGRGVSSCATCDGFFFKDRTVAVVGGGDTAVEDAIFLRRFAKEVYLLPRRNELRAKGPEARQAALLDTDPTSGFNILWSSTVETVNSTDDKVSSITYKDGNANINNLEVDGLFVAIGRDPATNWLKDSGVHLDDEGYILTEPNTTKITGRPVGVYAAGDAVDKKFRQAITSAGKAVEAALEAREYLMAVKHETTMENFNESL